MNAAQLCELLQGDLEGDGAAEIHGPSQIDKGIPGTVTFLANPKYEDHAYSTGASVLIVSNDFVPRKSVQATLIRVRDVYGAMMFLIEQFSPISKPEPGVSALAVLPEDFVEESNVSIGAFAVIEKGVKIGAGSIIYPQVYVGHHTVIGEDSIVYSGVRIYAHSKIGNRCILHSNAVIGSDGFGYRPDEQGHYIKINHVGQAVLEDDVEIGANSVVDRGTLQTTNIGKGTKIDNLVQVAHNVSIGEHTVIAAQTGIAGSTTIGNHVRIGGQVGIVGHIHVADRIEIQAQTGVQHSKFPPGSKICGYPAIPYGDYLKSFTIFKQLPAYMKRLHDMEKQLAELKERSS